MIDICLSLDASGSISNEQCKEFLTEVKYIIDQYKDFRIHLCSFDTEVFNAKIFNCFKKFEEKNEEKNQCWNKNEHT